MPIVGMLLDMAAKRRSSNAFEIGARIKRRRKELGLTQEQVCGQAGLTQGTLSLLERGATKAPEAETILQLAIVLKCTPQYLMWDHDLPGLPSAHTQMLDLWNYLSDSQRTQVAAYAQGLLDSTSKSSPKPASPRPFEERRRSRGGHD